jgi:hypothetical protein
VGLPLALHLALHLNEFSYFYYKYLRGDKDTFHLAWRMLRLEYAMPPYWPGLLYGRRSSRDPFPLPILEQYDFEGRALFQHLAGRTKRTAWGENMKVPGLQLFRPRCTHCRDMGRDKCARRVSRSRRNPDACNS